MRCFDAERFFDSTFELDSRGPVLGVEGCNPMTLLNLRGALTGAERGGGGRESQGEGARGRGNERDRERKGLEREAARESEREREREGERKG